MIYLIGWSIVAGLFMGFAHSVTVNPAWRYL